MPDVFVGPMMEYPLSATPVTTPWSIEVQVEHFGEEGEPDLLIIYDSCLEEALSEESDCQVVYVGDRNVMVMVDVQVEADDVVTIRYSRREPSI